MLRKTYRFRLNTLILIPLVCMGALIPRLYVLQVVRHDHYVKRAAGQHNKTIEIIPCRGKILDAGHHELAGSTMLQSAYVAPSLIDAEAAADLARHVSRATGIDYDTLYRKFRGKREVPLGRKLDASVVTAMRDAVTSYNQELAERMKGKSSKERRRLYVPSTALYFIPEGKRFYPRGELASHIIGYTELNDTGDNKGRAGVELSWDEELRGQLRRCKARASASRSTLEPIDPEVLNSSYGNTIVLTIDEAIQHCAETVLKRGVLETNADAGIIVVYGVKSGEVLAFANCPSFSLNDLRSAKDFQRRNRAITDAIEPGSVMKIFTFASLFDEQKITRDDMIDCEGGYWNMGFRTVVDSHRMGVAPAWEVFAESSNIGSVKAAQRMTPQTFYRHLCAFGFGEKTGLDLPGEATGLLRPVKQWSGLSMSSIPIGYEIQVSGVQVAAAMGAIANKGVYMQPHIVKEVLDYRGETVRRIDPKALRRVISPEASRQVLSLMEDVVVKGTGKRAALEHYRAGGKTGTTKKIDPETGRYSSKSYIASFCGVAPIEDPEIVVYIYIDNPREGSYYGGTVSAPLFKQVAETALKALKVPVRVNPEAASPLEIAEPATPARTRTRSPLLTVFDAARDDHVSSGSMPNLEGLTMREAQAKLSELGIAFRFEGSGVVIEQLPRAYETIESSEPVLVRFGPARRLMERIAETLRVGSEAVAQSESPSGYTIDAIRLERPGRPPALLTLEQEASHALPAPVVRRSAPEQPPEYPDVDSYARRKPDKVKGKRVWSSWEKEREKARKAAEAAQKAAAEAAEKAQKSRERQEASESEAKKSSERTSSRRGASSRRAVKSVYDMSRSR